MCFEIEVELLGGKRGREFEIKRVGGGGVDEDNRVALRRWGVENRVECKK